MTVPRIEQETTITYEHPTKRAHCWTSNPTVARRWQAAGWPVAVFGTIDGLPASWKACVPLKAAWRVSKLVDGALIRSGRKGGNPNLHLLKRKSKVAS